MLPGRRDHSLVEVHAADPDVSVPAPDRGDDGVTHAGAVIGERCGQVGREFLQSLVSVFRLA